MIPPEIPIPSRRRAAERRVVVVVMVVVAVRVAVVVVVVVVVSWRRACATRATRQRRTLSPTPTIRSAETRFSHG